MAETNNHIHSTFSHSEYSVAELIRMFQLCNDRISILHQHASEDFKALNVATRNHYKQVFAIHQTVSEIGARINQNHALLPKEIEDNLTYMSNIITSLQFDDIVRQKLEHIQQTIVGIIDELNSIRQKTNIKESQPIKYLSILSEITSLHAAQLIQTNQDYQKAFAGIKANLEGVQQSSVLIVTNINALLAQHESADLQAKLTYINLLSEQLSSQINCSLVEIKYCEAFAQEVEEINKHMQKIFSGWIAGIKSDSKMEILAQLEALYTMESERLVHHKVLDVDADLHKAQSNGSENIVDDNLELF
jgi:flagellin-specific chaperone FliS